MKHLKNKIAVITGAASGIGRATAIRLAEEKCHVAIADLNKEGLSETAEKIKKLGVNVTEHILNVADKEAVYAFANDVVNKHNHVNIIINNAGVSMTAKISQMEYEDFEWIMNINFWGVVYGTKAFLPYLRKAGEGHIVNISSLFGLVSIPNQSAYNASKFAVRGFTEALRMELEMYEKNISATSVHPGGIKTDIIRNSKIITKEGIFQDKEKATRILEKSFKTTPEEAAVKIIAGIKKNKQRVLIGSEAVLLDYLQRLFPSLYQKAVISNSKKTFITR